MKTHLHIGALIACFSLCVCWPPQAISQELKPQLRFPLLRQPVGQQILLTVYFHNEEAEAFQSRLPGSLDLQMKAENGTLTILTAFEIIHLGKILVRSGEFLKKTYRLVIPDGEIGPVEIALVEHQETSVLLNLTEPELSSKTSMADKNIVSQPENYPTLDSLFNLYQPYVTNFTSYEPVYFLVGTDLAKSKFQISFKYRPFNPAGTLSSKYHWLSGVHLAYTQTSFWDLKSNSVPFLDTSYKPGIFFLSRNIEFKPTWMKGFFIQTGIQHESNGRGGDMSRSTNYIYLKPIFIFYDNDSGLGLQVAPRFISYFNNNDDTNPDFAEYRGYIELELKMGQAKGWVSTTYLHFAERGTSVETNLSYPISKLLRENFDLFFQLQYSNSLAESLVDFRDRVESVRIGFSIIR